MQPQHNELHRIATTCIIYNKEGRFLLIHRGPNTKAHQNKWAVPGGGLEVSDYINTPPDHGSGWHKSIEKALIREIKEEVGLEIGIPQYLLNLTFIRPDGIPVLVMSYYAEYISGDVVLDEDTVDYAWLSCEEALACDLIPGVGNEIQLVDRLLKEQKTA